MNLAELFISTAARQPDRPAIRMDEAVVGYRELDEASARVAGLLAREGVAPGDSVGLMLPNVPEFPVVYYGILRAGAVVVPMNPLLKAREVSYYLSDSGARVLFAWPAAAEEAHRGAAGSSAAVVVTNPESFATVLGEFEPEPAVVDRQGSDTAVLLYTSGTTGQPKGAELTHANLVRNAQVTNEELLHLEPGDTVFGGLPLFHSFGQTVSLNTAMATGATLSLLPRFDAGAALDLMARHHVTALAAVPTMYAAFVGQADAPALPDLRVCVSGGAALPVEILHRFADRFGCPILEGYGLSETSPVACFNHANARKPGSIGTPVRGVEMRIVDEAGTPVPAGEVGEIAIRGHNVMKGYWRNPEATDTAVTADGWFLTGDVGRCDDDGFFYVVDRKKELVIRGGFNIYPREIEEVLYEHPEVAEAAVIGVPHPLLGEEVAAAVALVPGARATADEIRQFVRSQVAAYKYPRMVWILDGLPKGPTGKIQKRDIVPPAEAEDAATDPDTPKERK